MINKAFYNIFQKGSRTYFYSSLFFPYHVRKEVFILYSFVRKADNFVDQIPGDAQGFHEFKQLYHTAMDGVKSEDIVIDMFIELAKKKQFKSEWIEAFFHSMELDLFKNRYQNLDETLEYIYGSAEVIGLMMAQIMGLKADALAHAQKLGRAMQYINFIRDIAEDLDFGRIYFPIDDLETYGLTTLDYDYVKKHREAFHDFIEMQIQRYCTWQEIAEMGYHYIPRRYLISVKTASEMYNWTVQQIAKNPFIVYEWKVKPMISQIIATVVRNLVDTMGDTPPISKCPSANDMKKQ